MEHHEGHMRKHARSLQQQGCHNGHDINSSGFVILGASYDFAARIWTVNGQKLRHVVIGHCDKGLAVPGSL